jgi:hypothetical protein
VSGSSQGEQLAEASRNSAELFRQWRKHSGESRSALGISAQFEGWTKRTDVSLVGFPKMERSMDILNIAWASRLKGAPRESTSHQLREGFWANAAQAVQRRPWGGPGTLTANGVWYSFEHDCCLDGFDALRVQGAPTSTSIGGLSGSNMKELAGEAFFLGCIGTVVSAIFASPYASWWRGA